MAGRQYSLRLTEAAFPFRSDLFEKSALADEVPNAREKRIIPKVIYVENCIPSAQGWDSLDFQAPIPPTSPAIKFDKVHEFFTSKTSQRCLFSPAYGKAATIRDGASGWSTQLSLAGNPSNSIMYLRSETYFYFRGTGAYKYDEDTDLLVAVTLTGLVTANILGITSASNYAVGFDRNTLYYTSRVESGNAIDFTPTLGVAGSLQVLAIRGSIVTCLPYANGFIIYTKSNAVMASYSGNPNNPFTFREIPGSAGVLDEESVAWNTNIGTHFVWSQSGLQQVSPDRAQNLFPELQDFVRQRTVEFLNTTTGEITREIFSQEMGVKLTLIGHRFLAFSFGEQTEDPTMQTYSDVFILDLDLQRWGRIKEEHVDVFPYTFTGGLRALTFDDLAATTFDQLAEIRFDELVTQDPGGRNLGYKLGLLKLTGQVSVAFRANLADNSSAGVGKLLIGKLAQFPERMTELQEVRTSVSQLTLLRNFLSDFNEPLLAPSRVVTAAKFNLAGNSYNERYLLRATARAHTLLLMGRFHLTNAEIFLEDVGER